MNPPFASMPMVGQGLPAPPPPPAGMVGQQQLLSLGQGPQAPALGPGQGGPGQVQVKGLMPPAPAPAGVPAPGSIAGQAPSPGPPGGQMSTGPGVRPPAPSAGPPSSLPSPFPGMRPYPPPPMMQNYMSAPSVPLPQMMPPGVLGTAPAGMPPRYSAPSFGSMVRPTFVPRPPLGPPPPVTMSAVSLPRPPGNGLRPMPPVLKPPPGMTLTELAAKGVGQLAAAPEKPHTTVYVGKIAPTIEDDFLRALLELCGDIKSWKRAQDPTTGSPKGFGFCEFDSAEGVLRALRILNKYSLEGQDLVLNVNQATRDYLERYVAKKKEREKFMQQQTAEMDKEEELAPGVESIEAPKPSPLFTKDEGGDKDQVVEEDGKKFGLVSGADFEADEVASQKLSSMLEERSRLRPLPPPPPLPTGVDNLSKAVSTLETMPKSRDGDLSADATKSDDRSTKNDDDTTSDHKASGDTERNEMTSIDKNRRSERDRERDRERELEREKERELERYERERERERQRRERERDMRLREAERLYEEREREWEAREREKERQRLHDREREKDRERDRRKEIKEQEEESDDDEWKKGRYRASLLDEKRKRRLREREEDIADREREESEMLVKRQKIEESAGEKVVTDGEGDCEMDVAEEEEAPEVTSPQLLQAKESISVVSVSDAEDELPQKELNSNGIHNVYHHTEGIGAIVSNDADLKASPAPRKLGFGIMGSGRRATGLSVFHQEDEEEKTDDRKLRPLVPIDYSAEEMEAVATPNPGQATSPPVAPNLAAAAEFARSLSNFTGSKEDRKEDGERDRSRRKRDRPGERDMPRKEKTRDRDRDRERDREREREREDREREREREKEREKKDLDKEREKDHVADKNKVPDPKKILNAKQLIDTIPKTKEELFAYPVDWSIYDKHDLHERMRPWISKKITEFLGEEETTLVDFIVSNTCKHVTAASMLELLESILDDEAEMFVLKMWRMLIFEIRRVETGLASSKGKS